jgi:anthranilate synthase component 1
MAEKREYFPSLTEFKKLSKKGNLIPVYKKILADTDTPVSAFMKLNNSKNCFLLESVEGGEKWARYSFIGLNPSLIFKSRREKVTLIRNNKKEKIESSNPLSILQGIMQQFKPVELDGLPRFYGGAVGFMSYDMVKFFEDLPDTVKDDTDWNDSYFMITDTMVIFDNLKHNVKVVCNVHLDKDKTDINKQYKKAIETIDKIILLINRPLKKPVIDSSNKRLLIRSNVKKNHFISIVNKAKKYIRAGEIIQVVLSQRFETDLHTDPFKLYRSLRMVNPSPYMYYLKMDKNIIVGSSPEVLVRLENDEIFLRPIAGTRPRGKDEKEDAILANSLKKDPKEIAEHIMLVDLGRNDVGRVSKMGQVRVDDFMVIERYSHVMHLVSSVYGILKKGKNAFDVLAAAFPAGTVSGAPKIRAMEIIDELEKHRRGPYSGCVGYFGFTGNMDFCITIRTMLVKNNKIHIQAGAGIVMDSKPEKEFLETLNKARGMIKAIKHAHKDLKKCY